MNKLRYVQPTAETVELKMESRILEDSLTSVFWLGNDSSINGLMDYDYQDTPLNW